MKTLLLSEVFPPQTGGSGRWFWEVYSRLPREAVCVVAGESPGAEAFDRGQDIPVVRLPLRMPSWGVLNPSAALAYWRRFRELQKLVKKEGIHQLHAGRVLPEGWLAWMLDKWCGVPYAVYVHGEELSYGLQSRELGWMMRRVFGAAEKVIVNSRNTAGLIQTGWQVPSSKVTLLYPGVDTKRFQPRPVGDPAGVVPQTLVSQTAANAEDRGPTRTMILTVGRLQKRKGQDMLIQALPQIRAAIPDVLYVIAGDGAERAHLEGLARQEGVGNSVTFLGEVADELLTGLYQACDLFALPNREVNGDIEGFGMVLLEAQASGKPVLAGDSGGTVETMRPGETGVIVDCTQPESLALGIIELLRHPERREQMGQSARRWAVEEFDWESLAAKAQRIFEGEHCLEAPGPCRVGSGREAV